MRRPCQLCGSLFSSNKPQKKYCSPSCRVKVNQALARSYYAKRVAGVRDPSPNKELFKEK